MKNLKNIFSGKLHFIILLGMLLISIFIFRDYGIAWDDPEQREIGLTNYNFIAGENADLLTYRNRSYGIVIELPLVFIEKTLNLSNPRSIFFMRHKVLHLFFLLGVYFFYLLIFKLFNQKNIAIFGMLMLYLTPAIFAHSFFNSKDVPLLVFMIIGMYTLWKLILNPSYKNAIIHSIVSALACDTRIMGAIIPISTILIFVLFLLLIKKGRKSSFIIIGVYSLVFAVLFYALAPAMWKNPYIYLYETLARMSSFPWRYETLYLGKMISAQHLPWHYSFVWIFISIPIYYIIFMIFGYFSLYKNAISSVENFVQTKRLIFIALISDLPFIVIFALILINSTLYDGWRHLYFLFPFLLLMTVFGLNEFEKISSKIAFLKKYFNIIILIFIGITAVQMINLHPYQQVYFNTFVSHKAENIRKKMEMDYWGLSYKEALENIAKTDTSNTIYVRFENYPGEANLLILPTEIGKRFKITNGEDWNYFISNYRQHVEEYEYKNVYYMVKRSGSTINVTFKK